jgi:hypothetical protein
MTKSHARTRADAARLAIDARDSNAAKDLAAAIQDLVTDLGHLCDTEGFDFVESVRRALRHWAVERIDPGSTAEGPAVDIIIGTEGLPSPPKPIKRPDKRKKSRPA